ncbi:MAG: DUF5979 domain-containing protein [Corynebacterium casei]
MISPDTMPTALQTSAKRVFSIFAIVVLLLTLLVVPPKPFEADAQVTSAPQAPAQIGTCGASIALVFDLSSHVSAGTLEQTKQAARDFVTQMRGSVHQIGVYTYATDAPAQGSRNTSLDPVSVRDQAGVNQLHAKITGLTKPTGSADGANWDKGLRQVLDSSVDFETVYFFAGGAPNHDRNGSNRWLFGDTTETVEIENAVETATALRQEGTRVIPIAAGNNAVNGTVTTWTTLIGLNWLPDKINVPVLGMLEQLATNPQEVLRAVGTGLGSVPGQMVNFGVPACVQVNKELVDADGEVLSPGQGWQFDVALGNPPSGVRLDNAQLTTSAQGSALTKIRGLRSGESISVTLTERQQESYELVPIDGKPARCTIIRPGVPDIEVNPDSIGENGVRVNLQASDALSCTFSNRELVPVHLAKTVSASPQALLEQLRGYEFDFRYECKARGREIASGEFPNMLAEQSVMFPQRIPVGAECTVWEVFPPADPILQDLQTQWTVTGGTKLASGDSSQEFSFRVDSHPSVDGVTIGVHNSYVAQTGSLMIDKVLDAESVPANQVPGQFPVRYFCRYIPNPNDRPELGGGGTNPADVTSGYTTVSEAGVAIIDDLPVGTQCGFEEVAEDGSTPSIDGFTLNTTWASDACLDYREAGTGIRECQSNYIRIPQSGEFTLEIRNSYERQIGALGINVSLGGDAADRGQDLSYLLNVRCVAEGQEIFSQTGIQVTPGLTTRITGVPVGADCTVTESGTTVPGVEVTQAAPSTVVVSGGSETTTVEVPLTLSAQEGSVQLTSRHDVASEIDDPVFRAELLLAAVPVSAQCWEPGAVTPTEWEGTITDGGTAGLESFPAGTICQFSSDYVAPIGAGAHLSFSPGSVEVTAGETADVELEVHFDIATTRLVLQHSSGLTAAIPDAAQLVPDNYTYNYQCSDDTMGTWTLVSGETRYVEVQEGTQCTITLNTTTNQAVERATTWTTPAEQGQSSSTTDNGLVEVVVNIPTTEESATVNIAHRYSPVMIPADISLNTELRYPDGTSADDIREAVLGQQGYLMSYSCIRNDSEVAIASRVLDSGEPRSLELPVGAECNFTVGGEELVSATGPETTWDGTGTTTDAGYTLTQTLSPQKVHATHAYTVKLGGFNLKKKVDGEGVATIDGDRQFDLNYQCILGGQVVQPRVERGIGRFDPATAVMVTGIPVGSECLVTEDAGVAAEPNADLSTRWMISPDATGWDAPEQACSDADNCTPQADNFSALLTIRDRTIPNVDELLPDNGQNLPELDPYFQGTLIIWNTYVYDKVQLRVYNDLAVDGPELAGSEEFTYSYRCIDPRYEQGGNMPDPTIVGVLRVTGEGEATELIPDPDNPNGQSAVPPRPIPVGFECEIRQNMIAGYDAAVTAWFGDEPDDPVDPTLAHASTTWVMTAEFVDTDYPLHITNKYERARADLHVSSSYDTQRPGDVSAYLVNSDAPVNITWQCYDPVLDTTYGGTTPTPVGGDPQLVTLGDNGQRLPASAVCSFTGLSAQERIPEDFEDLVRTASVTRWEEDPDEGETIRHLQTDALNIQDVSLTSVNDTHVSFSLAFYVPQREMGITHIVEGDDDAMVVQEGDTFSYNYQCEMRLLPGQPAPFDRNGIFELGRDQQWSQLAPAGTTCTVMPQEPSPELAERIEENALRVQPNYGYRGSGEDNGELTRVILDQENPSIILGNTPEADEIDRGVALVFQSLFREDGEVAVQKENADGTALEGAAFAIYPASPDGSPSGEAVIEDMQWDPEYADDRSRFIARLVPGTYFLVETRSGNGAQLMPQPWRFTVAADPEPEILGDLQISLNSETDHSGLITIEEPTADEPWLIRVANIATGELPLTGGRGIWPGVGLGSSILLLAAAWYAHTKRRED